MADEGNTSNSTEAYLHVKVDGDDHHAVRIAAALEGMNISDFVRERVLPEARQIASKVMKEKRAESL